MQWYNNIMKMKNNKNDSYKKVLLEDVTINSYVTYYNFKEVNVKALM